VLKVSSLRIEVPSGISTALLGEADWIFVLGGLGVGDYNVRGLPCPLRMLLEKLRFNLGHALLASLLLVSH